MPRRKITPGPEPVFSGRPPKDPEEKVGRPVRALVTPPVMDALEEAKGRANLNLSEVLRLALFRFLDAQGLITPELRQDPTWETLIEKGLV